MTKVKCVWFCLKNMFIVFFYSRYIEKVVEFLCLMASTHFFRYEAKSAKTLMSLLLQFTFNQKDGSFYYECLEIWSRILDHLNAQIPNKDNILESFKEPILSLASGIVESTAKFSVTTVDECFDVEVRIEDMYSCSFFQI